MKPILQDIAEKTGLSVSTVSRVLRGKSKRNSESVAAIIEAARSLNYPIYQIHSKEEVRNKKIIHVALVTNFHVGEFYSSFFDGFNKATAGTNFQLSLFNLNPSAQNVIDFLNHIYLNSYDAAILFLPMLSEVDYQQIIQHTPENFIIVSTATVYNPVLDTVTFDSYRGGHLVAKHFDQRGYKKVGVVLGDTNRNEALLRKSGFTDFIQHHSEMELLWQFEGDYTLESGQNAFYAYQKLPVKPRAIFISNDYMTLGFMEKARQAGIQIPEDVALVGYDDLPICSYHFPSISSVHTDYERLAKNTIHLLMEKIEKPRAHQGLVNMVPVTLSIRESS